MQVSSYREDEGEGYVDSAVWGVLLLLTEGAYQTGRGAGWACKDGGDEGGRAVPQGVKTQAYH